ncbi:MAG: M48 family metalloprotease, partial [Planctomycetota bacterium]|nr:M48 family metalloprotease [Planctomycetota bacterium]
MQVLVLLLLAAVMLADQGLGASWSAESIPPWLPPLVAFLPPVACVVLEYVLIRRTLRLAVGGSPASILRAGTRLRVLQWIVVGCSVVSLAGLGWLELVRAATGDVVVLDELLSILPALFLLAMLWWVQWPLERLLRESLLIRRLDEGLPVHPVPSAAGYVLWQFRTHLLLVLVPVLMILALVESAELAVSLLRPGSGIAPVAAGAAGLLGIVLAPFTMRLAVGAVPLADGPVRRAMEQVLREAGVRVRDILVWPTGTSMLNGAVIGVFPATRFVLLTDGLLELLSLDQVRAVMAHEAGHLRHRHLPWTAAMLFALVALVGQLVEWIVNPVFRLALETGADPGRLQSAFELVAVVV